MEAKRALRPGPPESPPDDKSIGGGGGPGGGGAGAPPLGAAPEAEATGPCETKTDNSYQFISLIDRITRDKLIIIM